MSTKMQLFHTGFVRISSPDLKYGRKNADFGQGFYLSDDEEFSKRWARERKDAESIINRYELDLEGLEVKTFSRGDEWFGYIFDNRALREDKLCEYDVIIGPIANDTLYDTLGIITSGLLEREQALKLLMLGREYLQIVIKSEKAKRQLRFISAEVLESSEIERYKAALALEEKEYQELFAVTLDKLIDG